MIIIGDEYGFVSYQDFRVCSNKMCETLKEYDPIGAMMIGWPHELGKQIPSLKSR